MIRRMRIPVAATVAALGTSCWRQTRPATRTSTSVRVLTAAAAGARRRLPLDVAVRAEPTLREQRFGSDVEVAAYFTVCEALTNIVKHARTGAAQVALSTNNGHLEIVVRDQGVGLSSGYGNGHGLTNLRDRIEALGGTLHIDGHPGAGTCVRAELPVGASHE
jgi:signal transduction histidine kinase